MKGIFKEERIAKAYVKTCYGGLRQNAEKMGGVGCGAGGGGIVGEGM